MYKIIDGNIEVTRGDGLPLSISTSNKDGSPYTFQERDVIRVKVFERKDCGCVVLQKDTIVETATTSVNVDLTKEETKIGELISRPIDYWYEVELNPDTDFPQTIIGYTKEKGAKLFTLLPEGGDKK